MLASDGLVFSYFCLSLCLDDFLDDTDLFDEDSEFRSDNLEDLATLWLSRS